MENIFLTIARQSGVQKIFLISVSDAVIAIEIQVPKLA